MAEVNQDLVAQLEANRASFEAAGPAFEEDVKNIDAKLAKVKAGKAGAPAPATAEAADDFESLTKEELQDELDARDLPTSGNKPDLIARLRGEE